MKVFFKRQWPLIGVGILLSLAAFYFLKAGRESKKEPPIEDTLPSEGLQLKDIHYTQDDPERWVKWILDAKEV